MHPYLHARSTPDKPAIVMASGGESVSYAELDQRSNQAAHLLRELGLRAGDRVVILIENNPRFLEVVWGAQRAGLLFACISHRLKAEEIRYIIENSAARVLVTSFVLHELAAELAPALGGLHLYMVDGARPPFASFEQAIASFPTTPIADQSAGSFLLYSSGTTGRPKGVRRLAVPKRLEEPDVQVEWCRDLFGVDENSVYLSPAPLYHAAPLGWSMTVHKLGGTVVVMERFDPEQALAAIEKYRITHAQWVPTHFVRMLKLPTEVRARYDLSSLKVVIHAAAPCPVWVKQAMFDWWGPIIHEYYGGSEGNGLTAVSPEEWLARPGTVGRAVLGEIRICDERGDPLPPRSEGQIFFAGGPPFEYVGDPEGTAKAANRHGWTTLGDIGWVDEEGYLFLTDRKDFMIISGGVNVYPQEIENVLIEHPAVADVAVIGAPDEEMGEKIVAVVQPSATVEAGEALAEDLKRMACTRLGRLRMPALVDFTRELPRHPNGKLLKRLLRDSYRAEGAGPGLERLESGR